MGSDQTPPRDGLFRAVHAGALDLVETDAEDGIGVLTGHFAVFDQWTEIDSRFEGRFLERFRSGSLKKTLSESRDRIRVLFQHGKDPVVADKPLGPIRELHEDEQGGYYEVPLLDTSYNRDLLPGLRSGLYGASMRFGVVREDVNRNAKPSAYNPEGLTERTVIEARIAEFGPVTFPAYDGATAGVRSITDLVRDVEAMQLATPILLDEERLGRAQAWIKRSIPPEAGETATTGDEDHPVPATPAEAEPAPETAPEQPAEGAPPPDDAATSQAPDTAPARSHLVLGRRADEAHSHLVTHEPERTSKLL